MEKKCYGCWTIKDEEEFPLIRTKRKGYCTPCYIKIVGKDPSESIATQAAANKRHNNTQRDKRKKIAESILSSTPCKDCGYHNPIALEFDHRDPSQKFQSVSVLIQSGTEKQLLAEIAKCDVVCCNCHRIRTANMFGSWRSNIEVINLQ